MSMIALPIAERKVIAALLDAAISAGYAVSVHDGEGYSAKSSVDQTAARLVIGDTDETTLLFRDPASLGPDGKAAVVGSVFLVHGNDGPDVIADYSDNPAMRALVAPASAVAAGFL